MTFIDPSTLLTAAVFVTLAVLFLRDEYYGVLATLAFLVLFDRNFAYLHLPTIVAPLYVSEFSLLCWTFAVLLKRLPDFRSRLRETYPLSFLVAWAVFAGVGVLSLMRGLMEYPLERTLRDFVMVLYSGVLLLVPTLPLTLERVRRGLQVLAGAVALKALMICVTNGIHSWPACNVFNGQPAAASLLLCLATLLYLGHVGMSPKSIRAGAWLVFLFSAILLEEVRSSWTGFAAGIIVLIGLMNLFRRESTNWRRIALKGSGVMAGTGVVLILMSTNVVRSLSRPAPAPITDVPPVAQPPAVVVTPSAPVTPTAPSTPLVPPAPVARVAPRPLLVSTPAPPAVPPAPPPKPAIVQSPINSIASELASFGQGRASNNVQTRLWMWQDAVSEVFGIHLFSPYLTLMEAKRYNLVKAKIGSQLVLPVRADGLSSLRVTLPLSSSEGRIDFRYHLRRVFTAAFGLPFGKLYLPPQIVTIVNSPHRYDPHSALIAVLYRLGVVGFVSFVALLYLSAREVFRALQAERSSPRAGVFLSMAAGLTCHVIHSCTDNTIENFFKGIWLWLLIASIFWARAHCRRSHETPHRS